MTSALRAARRLTLVAASALAAASASCQHAGVAPVAPHAPPDEASAAPAARPRWSWLDRLALGERPRLVAGAEPVLLGPAAPRTTAPARAIPMGSERRPGDYIVYRFSGSYVPLDLTLTERVVAREGDVLLVEVTLDDEVDHLELRARVRDGDAAILSVERWEGGRWRPISAGAFEQLMDPTVPLMDASEGLLGTASARLELGEAELACARRSYRVSFAGMPATMHSYEHDGFAWGDLGAEIVSDEGLVLYRAQVVDLGSSLESAAGPGQAVAAVELTDPYDDLE
jgi:hypothetical protein